MPANILKELDETIYHGGEPISFKILLSRRKTISIMVCQDRTVKVRAPYRTSIKYIKNSVQQRAGWIKSKQSLFGNSTPIPMKRDFENGEIYSYLGKKYRLQINRDLVNKVSIENDLLNVSVTNINKDKIKNLIDNWYRKSASEIFSQRLDICKNLALEIGINYKGTPKLRKMKSRWGSCSKKGDITLSYELVKTKVECIDYVILHEICHIKEFNHSKLFYSLLDKIMPDWKFRRNELNKTGAKNDNTI